MDEAELWKARYEASELRHQLAEWKAVVSALQQELRESNRLLRQQRLPPRPRLTQMERIMVAARQGFKCQGVNCPLKATSDCVFSADSLWEIDHIGAGWAATGRHSLEAVCALCPSCHAAHTRQQILERNKARDAEQDESDGNGSAA